MRLSKAGLAGDSRYWFDGIHLMAPTDEELHNVAVSIGLPRSAFQYDARHSHHCHYDVWGAPAKKLTVNCTTREMLRWARGAAPLAASALDEED